MRLSRFLHCPVAFLAAAFGAASAPAAPLLRDIIAPHRAVYEIGLARSEEGSGVSSARGRMVFEITGSACDGYAMRQRMQVDIGDEDGNLGLLDFRVTTFESGDGATYSFDSRTTLNEKVVEEVEGKARRQGSGIEVNLTQPSAKTVTLDGSALFPSQLLQTIIDTALAERRFLAVDIYEGAGSGETSDEASAAIGAALPPGTQAPLRAGVRSWPVSVGYFGRSAAKSEALGEEIPSYQMSFTLYENGVTNDLVMDYGDYALSGSLQTLEALARPDCGAP